MLRTCENGVTAKFANSTFHELRRCRSELPTSRGLKEEE